MTGIDEDRWSGADSYARFMGRWSRLLARCFVAWLDVPAGGHWLEVGCGTGELTRRVCEVAAPDSMVAIDSSEEFVEHARRELADPRVDFLVAGAERLPRRPGGFDAVVSSLVLNFLPDPKTAAREMRAVMAEGGVVGACVWDYADGMAFLRCFWDAAVALDPLARDHDEGERFSICSPGALEEVFREAGFGAVRVESLEVPTLFRDFEDYWQPFIGGPGPAPGYASALSDSRRGALVRRLEATLPRRPDGTIPLTAKAWVVRAER